MNAIVDLGTNDAKDSWKFKYSQPQPKINWF